MFILGMKGDEWFNHSKSSQGRRYYYNDDYDDDDICDEFADEF